MLRRYFLLYKQFVGKIFPDSQDYWPQEWRIKVTGDLSNPEYDLNVHQERKVAMGTSLMVHLYVVPNINHAHERSP